jgi:hypothetical protein
VITGGEVVDGTVVLGAEVGVNVVEVVELDVCEKDSSVDVNCDVKIGAKSVLLRDDLLCNLACELSPNPNERWDGVASNDTFGPLVKRLSRIVTPMRIVDRHHVRALTHEPPSSVLDQGR